MIGRTHLHDDRLYHCYLAEHTGDAIDPRAADHLDECPRCAARYHELTTFLEGISLEGTAEADELFTIDRLQRQRETILHRLEHAGRTAKVISFPGHPTNSVAGPVSRSATRWLAAAAAAGLFVGVAVGGAFLPSQATPARALAGDAVPAPARAVPAAAHITPSPASEAIDDDRFLRELEVALQRPHTRELLPFDNLTPHMREINNQVR